MAVKWTKQNYEEAKAQLMPLLNLYEAVQDAIELERSITELIPAYVAVLKARQLLRLASRDERLSYPPE